MEVILGYEGIGVTAATFKLDEATIAAIGAEKDAAKGKGVSIKANDTVGFGASGGSPLFGFITKIDGRNLATIQFKGFRESVPVKKFGGTPAYPAVGEIGLGVDEVGNVVKLTAGKLGVLTALGDTAGDTTTGTVVL